MVAPLRDHCEVDVPPFIADGLRVLEHGRMSHRALPLLCAAWLLACGDSSGTGGAGTAGNASAGGAGAEGSGGSPSEGGASVTGGGSSNGGSGNGGSAPSSGCGAAAAPGQQDRTITVGAETRSYSIRIPDPYDPAVAHPMVFALHGAGSNGAGAVGSTLTIGGIPSITVGPTAAGQFWNAAVDLPLVDALVAALPQELCVDNAKLFAWGYSSGGFMANDIGCQRADVFRGIGLVDGGGSGLCQTPIGVWITHNQDDMTVPVSYGTGARDAWLQTNGCATTTTPTEPSPCVSYDGCSAGHPVVWCNPATGGHNPPGYTGQGLSLFFSSL